MLVRSLQEEFSNILGYLLSMSTETNSTNKALMSIMAFAHAYTYWKGRELAIEKTINLSTTNTLLNVLVYVLIYINNPLASVFAGMLAFGFVWSDLRDPDLFFEPLMDTVQTMALSYLYFNSEVNSYTYNFAIMHVVYHLLEMIFYYLNDEDTHDDSTIVSSEYPSPFAHHYAPFIEFKNFL